MSVSPSAEIRDALSAAGLQPADVESAVTAHLGLDANAGSALLGIVEGGSVSLTSLAPLIAAGLAATGVGAPIVAAVAAALPIINAIAGAIFPPDPKFDWIVGSVGFNAERPYGPGDPQWTTWERFSHGMTLRPASMARGAVDDFGRPLVGPALEEFAVNAKLDGAFPFYRKTIARELLGPLAHPSTPEEEFRRAYAIAWQANAEYAINGYNAAHSDALLEAVAASWNATHEPGAGFTIGADDRTFLGKLIAGEIDRGKPWSHRLPPVTLHSGARLQHADPNAKKIGGKGGRLPKLPPARGAGQHERAGSALGALGWLGGDPLATYAPAPRAPLSAKARSLLDYYASLTGPVRVAERGDPMNAGRYADKLKEGAT